MYLLGLLIIDQIFLGLINTLDFTNNLDIGIRATLIDFEAIKFFFYISGFYVFLVFFGFVFYIRTLFDRKTMMC